MCTGSALFPNPRGVPKGIGPHRVQQHPHGGSGGSPPPPALGNPSGMSHCTKGSRKAPTPSPTVPPAVLGGCCREIPGLGSRERKGAVGARHQDGQTDRRTDRQGVGQGEEEEGAEVSPWGHVTRPIPELRPGTWRDPALPLPPHHAVP